MEERADTGPILLVIKKLRPYLKVTLSADCADLGVRKVSSLILEMTLQDREKEVFFVGRISFHQASGPIVNMD
jgi:hypothetical protein